MHIFPRIITQSFPGTFQNSYKSLPFSCLISSLPKECLIMTHSVCLTITICSKHFNTVGNHLSGLPLKHFIIENTLKLKMFTSFTPDHFPWHGLCFLLHRPKLLWWGTHNVNLNVVLLWRLHYPNEANMDVPKTAVPRMPIIIIFFTVSIANFPVLTTVRGLTFYVIDLFKWYKFLKLCITGKAALSDS